MKVLAYFVDMLRADLAENRLETSNDALSEVLREIGGEVFCQAHTPAPDTPRSLASLFFGEGWGRKGFGYRSDWPGLVPVEEIRQPSIFRKLLDQGFEIAVFLSVLEIQSGRFLPKDASLDKNLHVFSELEAFYNFVTSSNGGRPLFVFFQNNDYHHEVDRLNGHPKADLLGAERVGQHLKNFLKTVGPELFTSIYVFSDHGCRFSNEPKGWEGWLDRRSRIYLQKAKADFSKPLRFHDHLVSIGSLHKEWAELLSQDEPMALYEPELIVVEDYPPQFHFLENRRLTEWLIRVPEAPSLPVRLSASGSLDYNLAELSRIPKGTVRAAAEKTASLSGFLRDLERFAYFMDSSRHSENLDIPSQTFLDGAQISFKNATKKGFLKTTLAVANRYVVRRGKNDRP